MFIELTEQSTGHRFLFDPVSGWEIYDKGAGEPAHWVNHSEGRNLSVRETYEEVKSKLLGSAGGDS